jgi:hypothetical protein
LIHEWIIFFLWKVYKLHRIMGRAFQFWFLKELFFSKDSATEQTSLTESPSIYMSGCSLSLGTFLLPQYPETKAFPF